MYKLNGKGEEYFIYDPTTGSILGWVGDLPSDPTSTQTPTKVNFDPTTHTISEQWPPPTPSQYTAQAGETFEQIAQALQGDESYAYLIAMANGYSPGDRAPIGRELTIPSFTVAGNTNRAGQFVPYNPGAIIGTLYPYMPIPPQKEMPIWVVLLEAFIAVLIMSFAPGLGQALVGLFAPGFWGSAFAWAIATSLMASVTDIAEQGIRMGPVFNQNFLGESWVFRLNWRLSRAASRVDCSLKASCRCPVPARRTRS